MPLQTEVEADAHRPVTSRRSKAVERRTYHAGDGVEVHVAHFHATGSHEKGIVLIPSLIGGSFILFGRQFRLLMQSGYRVVSFNYRGHPPSTGRFSLRTSYEDMHGIATELKSECPGTPLFAVGMCAGSLPIFHIVQHDPGLFERLAFVNAIWHVHQTASPVEAAVLYFRRAGLRIPTGLGSIASTVLDDIFPELDKGPDHFGILPYANVDLGAVAREYLLRIQPRVEGAKTPVLCCYGQGDAMLRMEKEGAERTYREAFAGLFPNIEYATFPADHFMTGIEQDVSERVLDFFDERD